MFDRDRVIADIIDPMNDRGQLPQHAELEAPPPFVMPQHEEDEYGSVGDCYIIEGDKFEKIKISELRKKKCEWTMGGQLLQIIQCRCHERVFEDDKGDEWVDLKICLYNPNTKKYEVFDDNFEKHAKDIYGLNRKSATALVRTLLDNNTGDWVGIFMVK